MRHGAWVADNNLEFPIGTKLFEYLITFTGAHPAINDCHLPPLAEMCCYCVDCCGERDEHEHLLIISLD